MSAGAKRPALSVLVGVRVSAGVADSWREQAQAVGLGLSDLIRSRMSTPGQEPERTGRPSPGRGRGRGPAPKADPALVAQLARIGNNLNQLARRANTIRGVDVAMLATLQSIGERLDETLLVVALSNEEANKGKRVVVGDLT